MADDVIPPVSPEVEELITQLLTIVRGISDTQERINVIAFSQARLALALYSQVARLSRTTEPRLQPAKRTRKKGG